MDESFIVSEFDRLIQSGLALYDENQKIIEHVEGGLKVSSLKTAPLSISTNS